MTRPLVCLQMADKEKTMCRNVRVILPQQCRDIVVRLCERRSLRLIALKERERYELISGFKTHLIRHA